MENRIERLFINNCLEDNHRSVTFKMVDLFESILDRIDLDKIDSNDSDSIYESVYKALDDGLIYSEDMWFMMACYQSPEDANWDDAYDMFTDDLIDIVRKYKQQENK